VLTDHHFTICRELHESYRPLIKSYKLPPSPPVMPRIFSIQWFNSLLPNRPFLPPALRLSFPLNIVRAHAQHFQSVIGFADDVQVIYLLLPILVPVGISMGLVRFSLASRASRARIKLLEKDASNGQKLIHVISTVEQRVEDAMVEFVEDPTSESDSDSSALALATTNVTSVGDDGVPLPMSQGKPQPLNALQRQMAAWLNALPQLRKEKAFILGVKTSHAIIVCRDVTRFPAHRMGEGVIRHWADHFVL
jgi:hypothetical protein